MYRLKTRLARHGLTEKALAAEIGVSRDTLWRQLSGKSRLKEPVKRAIEAALEKRLIPAAGIWETDVQVDGWIMEKNGIEVECGARPALRLLSRTLEVDAEVEAIADPKPGVAIAPSLQQKEEYMLSTRECLTREEMKFFNLPRDPFDEDPDQPWMGPRQKAIAQRIWRATFRHEILALVGEVGSGKTTLLRQFLAQVQGDRRVQLISPATFDRAGLTEGGIATSICRALAPGEPIPSAMEDRSARVHELLQQAGASNLHPVLILDEAHDLPTEAFIALKRVWDTSDLYKLIGVILVGQGNSLLALKAGIQTRDLGVKLTKDFRIRELAQRTRLVYLEPMSAEEIQQYVTYRFTDAQADAATVFDSKAWEALASTRSLAYPLALNNYAVLAMRKAYKLSDPQVSAEHVARATS